MENGGALYELGRSCLPSFRLSISLLFIRLVPYFSALSLFLILFAHLARPCEHYRIFFYSSSGSFVQPPSGTAEGCIWISFDRLGEKNK